MRRAFLLFLTCLTIPACIAPEPDEAARYATWKTTSHAAGLSGYERVLSEGRVADVVPMQALLRSSRRWRACDAEEFALPPPDRAAAIIPTLRVVQQLQASGWLDGHGIRSGYRSPALNTCSGGSSRSRHLDNTALDFDLPSDAHVEDLCRFWREQGPALAMGLGFYTPTKIHIDTSGHRTWGKDYRRETSLCITRTQTP
ncbi:D-Ala-D-Ala carboxypeptidase family metallohydrolase [Pseudoxanthomonas sp. Root630]|uniref:D-Ala-D-Ala carboxypeptidase family metallohydrolase n=1 Tax=Pseudoxanthomonas sp. Root630 TaxID=1736574 RepID=UPI000703AFC3|nr:D-Ala-D-Ala carboxypeptidase family metallohydrolase [Pseudoxanthomonas sp. Root630]KRA41831.1 hypothetical protein ASD72_14675 [Pseudoxanthomonas sp. Root630]